MEITKARQAYFTRHLMDWHHSENNRSLPWKGEKDPYKIWLSEIILQQTRAEQGLPYYQGFIKAYPTVNHLAKAKDEDAFRLWQGLGYYNRCRNMLATARYISGDLKGKFPSQYEAILELKGIGPYTAAAIASFGYGLPHAVVDGNVYRVLARFFGIDIPSDSTEGKKLFQQLAQELLFTPDSGAYNQAIMDLGATVCTPKAPVCNTCPLKEKCIAFKHGLIAILPLKVKKVKVQTRYFHYLLFTKAGSLWIRKRTAKDIWQNLYEPYLIEYPQPLDSTQLLQEILLLNEFKHKNSLIYEGHLSQRLTHRQVETRFFSLEVTAKDPVPAGGNWIKFNELKNFGFPKTIVSFLEKKLYF
jgi:A/G-specific adenine glycosylase